MTNTMIKAIDIEPGQRIMDRAGDIRTVSRVRRIDNTRCRIDTLEGNAMIVNHDDCFHLDD